MSSPFEVFTSVEGSEYAVGRVFPNRRGFTFSYSEEWIEHPMAYAITPSVPLRLGQQPLLVDDHGFPTALSDSAPDRWGRGLIDRQFREELHARPTPIDYLLGVADEFRLGALRFRAGGVVQAPTSRVPKVLELDELERAARLAERGEGSLEVIRRITQAGSSLGGARPKATVIDERGRLMMAKFTSAKDEYDVVAWEKVCLDIAAECGISVPATKLLHVDGRPVLLLERFDRGYDEDGTVERIPYLSAMTLMNRVDGETATMVDIAEAFEVEAAEVSASLRELWMRAALNLLIGNTDNHLRNHGFLRVGGKWQLSPVFDINPATAKTDFATPIDAFGRDSVATLLSSAEWFRLDQEEAIEILAAIVRATEKWRDTARENQIPRGQDRYVAPGFESAHAEEAREVVRGVTPRTPTLQP